MYGNSLGNSGITHLTNYEQALRHYETVEPIKGNGVNAGIKPLGARRKPQFQIIKHNNESIACRLYKTDVVTFHPDNTITFNTGNYNTSTTANFIAQVLSKPCGKFDNRLVLTVQGGAYTVNGMLTLRSEGGGWYRVERCEQDIVHTIDRKAMNAVRKDVRGFINYVSGMLKMQEGVIEKDTLEEGLAPLHLYASNPNPLHNFPRITLNYWRLDYPQVRSLIDRFMGLVRSGDAGNWYLSFLWLIHSSPQTWSATRIRYTHEDVMGSLNDILLAANTHVLKRELVEAGCVKVDRYKKFKRFMEEA